MARHSTGLLLAVGSLLKDLHSTSFTLEGTSEVFQYTSYLVKDVFSSISSLVVLGAAKSNSQSTKTQP